MSLTARRVNTYLAILIVTLFGTGAALLIIRIASLNTYSYVTYDEVEYAKLLH